MTRVALCALLAATAAAAETRPRVVIVKSSELAAYNQVVAGFTAEAKAQVEVVTLDDNAEAQAKAFKQLADGKPALVFAIGPAAATGAKRAIGDAPILFSMVPYYEKYELEGANVTGIALTSDFSAELAAVKAIVPDGKRVGILHDPRYSQKIIDDAGRVAKGKGVSIVPVAIDAPKQLDKALKAAAGEGVDAMLLIADKTVGNAAVVKKLIAWCAETKVPLVALSASQVKEGALLSLSPSFVGLGQQAGRLANRIVHEKVDPGALAVAQPEVLDLAVNLTTAQRAWSSPAQTMAIFQYAARAGYEVRVFE